jgi:hypothetical protein
MDDIVCDFCGQELDPVDDYILEPVGDDLACICSSCNARHETMSEDYD